MSFKYLFPCHFFPFLPYFYTILVTDVSKSDLFRMVQASQLCLNQMGVPLIQHQRKEHSMHPPCTDPGRPLPWRFWRAHRSCHDSAFPCPHCHPHTANTAASWSPRWGWSAPVSQNLHNKAFWTAVSLTSPTQQGLLNCCQCHLTYTTRPSELLSVSPHLHNKAFWTAVSLTSPTQQGLLNCCQCHLTYTTRPSELLSVLPHLHKAFWTAVSVTSPTQQGLLNCCQCHLTDTTRPSELLSVSPHLHKAFWTAVSVTSPTQQGLLNCCQCYLTCIISDSKGSLLN